MYPDDIHGGLICKMEGCDYLPWKATCTMCGEVNHRLKGYIGYVARRAHEWGVEREEAERRLIAAWKERDGVAGKDRELLAVLEGMP